MSAGIGAARNSSTKLPHIWPTREPAAMTQRGGGTGWSSTIFLYSTLGLLDRGRFFLIQSVDLGLDVLEDVVLVARALVLGELDLIDLRLLLLGEEEERLADGRERLAETALLGAVVLAGDAPRSA